MQTKNILQMALLSCALSVCGCGMTRTQSVSITPQAAAVAPGQAVSFTATGGGGGSTLTWSVNGIPGGNATVGTVDSKGNFTAPSTSQGAVAQVGAQAGKNSASASVAIIPAGQVTATNNPQVAQYTISPPLSASVVVQFSTDTSYGLTTWTQMAAGSDAPLSMLVAGMRSSTPYHMRAVLTLSNGAQFTDADHVFTTGSINASTVPQISVSTPSGLTPQPGVEMVDVSGAGFIQAFATDLSGNVIWNYVYSGTPADLVNPIKLLPNGHLIVCIGALSTWPLAAAPPTGTIEVIREVDLAGNTVRELDLNTLNQKLASAGFNLVADTMHHDVTPLPNGHLLVIVNSTQQFSNLTGIQGTTTVLGDQIVDLDPNWNPVWVWNSFNHLDINRHPISFPDWTHSNAVIYSKDDGNIIVSMRHQNWLLKINYNNGQGDGGVIWHLGFGGDFTLEGGTDPTDWFSAQHGPSFVSTNTTGVFTLAVFDDGNFRQLAPGAACGTPVQQFCLTTCACYSTGDVLKLDENAKTATLVFQDVPNLFSYFGGNAEVLANGDLEYDLSAAGPSSGGIVLEVAPQENPRQVVWQMNVGASAYRAFRLPSLYPGVQW